MMCCIDKKIGEIIFATIPPIIACIFTMIKDMSDCIPEKYKKTCTIVSVSSIMVFTIIYIGIAMWFEKKRDCEIAALKQRLDVIEKSYKELLDKVGVVDSKVGAVDSKVGANHKEISDKVGAVDSKVGFIAAEIQNNKKFKLSDARADEENFKFNRDLGILLKSDEISYVEIKDDSSDV